MDRSLVIRRLCWKEYRQLWPLIAMLAVMGFLLQFFLAINRFGNEGATLPLYFFYGLPGLFAAGVGALLVGQEKESRTLYWIASLPIYKQDIIRIKFLAGFAGLVAVWILSFVMMLLTGGLSNEFGTISMAEIDLAQAVLYSIFLLVLGFATAWGFRSTFVGLLVLVGVALAYTFASNSILEPLAVNTLALLVASFIAIGVGWVYALRALSPITPTFFSAGAIQKSTYFERSIVDKRAIQTPWSALIWQFTAQNRAMLLGISAIFLISLLSCCVEINKSDADRVRQADFYDILPFVLTAILAISWLGTVAFQGDNLNQRIRFLADRGVAPRIVWTSRQIVPIAMLILAAIILAVAATGSLIWSGQLRNFPQFGLSTLIAMGSMWAIYSVTQWTSQIIRSPVIAAILAPVVTFVVFIYGSTAFEMFETPIWLFGIVTFIPLVATYRMTRNWMDSKMGKRFWLEHIGWLALSVLIPMVPFLIVWATYPSMPGSVWAEFVNEISKHQRTNRRSVEITLLSPPRKSSNPRNASENIGGMDGSMGSTNADLDEPVVQNQLPIDPTMEQERLLQWNFIERQLKSLDEATPLSESYLVMRRLMGDAMIARIHMEDDGTTEKLLERYQRNITGIIRIIRGVRLGTNLKTQLAADRYEAWLVQEVQREGAKKRLGEANWSDAIAQLSNSANRKESRFRALCLDFNLAYSARYSRIRSDHTLGGYSIPTDRSGTRLISSRHVATVAWHLKQLLDAKDESELKQAKETVALDWDISVSQIGMTATPYINNQRFAFPCHLWHGDWEKQAAALK